MAAAAPHQPDQPQQLWLDVAPPLQSRPRRTTKTATRAAEPMPLPPSANQLELRINSAPSALAVRVASVPPPVPVAVPSICPSQSFTAWLLAQSGQRGTLGELAKAAKLDPAFPRKGSADDVRMRFSAVGADGDAFAALDDAERAYDRAMIS